MKSKYRIIFTASTACFLGIGALAEDKPNAKSDRPDYSADRIQSTRRMNRLNEATKANEIIGMTVKNYQDEKLGKVEDLAVDIESGRVVQVIVSTGGFVGIGDHLTAVPPAALHHDVVQKVLHLDASKDKIKSGPKFEMSKWDEGSDYNRVSEVYRIYGEGPSFTFVHKGDPTYDTSRDTDKLRNKDYVTSDHYSMIPMSRLSRLQKASKIIGTKVDNLQDEKLGKVENLLVDLPSGRVVAVVVSSGGFLGLGDELSAVPPSAFKYSGDRSILQLDTTKEMLTSAPHFKSSQWPDFAQPSYTDEVYRAYRVHPYYSTDVTDPNRTDVTKDADNTRRNVRDRDDRTLTPLSQGNNRPDIAMTARIRKDIVAMKNLSVNAHNVKVITLNGRVTLRGPVNSEDEKRIVVETAERAAGAGNVDNQLEVTHKNTTSSNN